MYCRRLQMQHLRLAAMLLSCVFLHSTRGAIAAPPRPKLVIAILARNAGSHLPYFLWCLDRQSFPKDRISLWIRVADSGDNTHYQLLQWSSRVKSQYASIDIDHEEIEGEGAPRDWQDSTECYWMPHCWNEHRFRRMIKQRQNALDSAHAAHAERFLSLDTDVFLINPDTIEALLAENLPVVAPLVHSFNSWECNFWGGVDANGYYKSSTVYYPIARFAIRGAFQVPVLHSVYLIDLTQVPLDALSYVPQAGSAVDDVVAFASSARSAGIAQYVLNKEVYGLMMPYQDSEATYRDDYRLWAKLYKTYLDNSNPLATFLMKSIMSDKLSEYHEEKESEYESPELYNHGDKGDQWHMNRQIQLCAEANMLESQSPRLIDESAPPPQMFGTCSWATSPRLRYRGIGVEHVWTKDLHVTLFHNLVTDEEAAILKREAAPRMERSVIHDIKTGKMMEADYRTQDVAWINEDDHHEVVRHLNNRLHDVTGLSLESAEEVQIGKYDLNGGQYEAHFDFQNPDHMEARGEWRGNRLATMLIYLSDGYEMGNTVFTRAGITVPPTKNTGVFWYNLHPTTRKPSVATKHAGCPTYATGGVTTKAKWVVNKWFRETDNHDQGRITRVRY